MRSIYSSLVVIDVFCTEYRLTNTKRSGDLCTLCNCRRMFGVPKCIAHVYMTRGKTHIHNNELYTSCSSWSVCTCVMCVIEAQRWIRLKLKTHYRNSIENLRDAVTHGLPQLHCCMYIDAVRVRRELLIKFVLIASGDRSGARYVSHRSTLTSHIRPRLAYMYFVATCARHTERIYRSRDCFRMLSWAAAQTTGAHRICNSIRTPLAFSLKFKRHGA